MSIEIRRAKSKKDIEIALKIREYVFVKGQDIEKSIDVDGLDEKSEHIVLFYDNIPVGCARIRSVEEKAKIERVAILDECRGKGLGKKLVEFAVEYAHKEGIAEVCVDSQYQVKDFYAKMGFSEVGKPFLEAGKKHVKMSRKL